MTRAVFGRSSRATGAAVLITALSLATVAGAQSPDSGRAEGTAARDRTSVDSSLLSLQQQTGADTSLTHQKERLGHQVFVDPGLSQPAGQACAFCHLPGRAFSSPGPTSPGADATLFGFRNAPGLTYGMFTPPLHKALKDGATRWLGGQFRDGRAKTLEAQSIMPLTNPIEMGNPDLATVVAKVASATYGATFRHIYGDDVFSSQDAAVAAIEDAIATYERGPDFQRFDSKYDAWVLGKAALTDSEERGRRIFNDPGRGNCASCHQTVPGKLAPHALFTDYGYDNVGVPRNPGNPYYTMPPDINPHGRAFVDIGLMDTLGDKEYTRGQFKAPSLRNVAVTGPYMHNGYFKTLRGVLDFLNTRDVKPRCADKFTSEAKAEAQGCWPEPEVKDNVNRQAFGNLALSEQDIDDLLAFLGTLTDGWQKNSNAVRETAASQ